MSKSIKANYIFNLLNTVSGLLFPLIAFPYASRIIMAKGIGQVQFYTSIINYIILLTGLGIPLYGIKCVSQVRESKLELAKTTIEILTLNLLLNLVGYIAIIIFCFNVPKISENIPLFLLLSSSIFLTSIGCNWFFSGVEDFKYIAIRGIIVKTICLLLLFLLVKNSDDVIWYGLYTVIGSIGNNVLNFHRLKKYIRFNQISLKELNIVKHIKPASNVFVCNIIISIYTNLDTVMLGFIKTSESVGYYTAASKISHILVTIVTSLGVVLLPRLSNLISKNEMQKFQILSQKAYDYIVFMSLPLTVGLFVLAPSIITLFAGENYSPAINTLRCLSPLIVAIGLSNLIGVQILYPLEKISLVTKCTIIGAIVNFILNIILIPKISQNGAAIASSCAELSVSISMFVFSKRYLKLNPFSLNAIKYAISSIIMGIGCWGFYSLELPIYYQLTIIPIVGSIIYFLLIIFFKDSISKELLKKMHSKFTNHI
ncbi:flippase [Segatella baroniae]|uniref:flippase n=1 Tax=Segatella baroniae TaxID=305719 RepID=UPI00040C3686|nr:flippase [Segatella baroniae]